MSDLPKYTPALIMLLQGVVYPDDSDSVWKLIIDYKEAIENYFAQIGVELIIGDGREYAYLSQPKPQDGEVGVPRLIPSHWLTLHTTALLVILREYVLEHENKQQTGIPIIRRDEMIERLKPLINDGGSQTAFEKKVDASITDTLKVRLLRELAEGEYEIRALIKARVRAEKIAELIEQIQQNTSKD